MKEKARMQVMCQLSDAQEQIIFGKYTEAKELINFTKYLILQCEGNLNQEKDIGELHAAYKSWIQKS